MIVNGKKYELDDFIAMKVHLLSLFRITMLYQNLDGHETWL